MSQALYFKFFKSFIQQELYDAVLFEAYVYKTE